MESKKLSQEQLQQILDIQQKYSKLVQELGNIELEKINLKDRKQAAKTYLSQLQQEEQEITQEIEQEYGKVTIDLGTGEITPIE